MGGLELEELRGVLPALLLAALHLHHQLLALLPPVAELLLQDSLLLVQGLTTAAGLGGGEDRKIISEKIQNKRKEGADMFCLLRLLIYLLQVHAEIFHLSLQPLFGFLQ